MSDRPTPWASHRTRVHYPRPSEPRPQHNWNGFHVERLRAPARGRDAGLFVVRSPDGVTRVAVVKGLDTRSTLTPHRVARIIDRLELGPDLLRVWPTTKRAPGTLDLRDSVGEYRTALQFAFELARDLYRASTNAPIEDSTP